MKKLPLVTKVFIQVYIRFQGAKVWNDISNDIMPPSLKRFKKKLKSIFIDKYLLQMYKH